MALAAAKARLEDTSALSLTSKLLGAGDCAVPGVAVGGSTGVASSSSSSAPGRALPADFILVLTQCLPDGLGDLIFGESAVNELSELAPVAWIRCYTSEEVNEAGEALVADRAAACCLSVACCGRERLGDIRSDLTLESLWGTARQRFLAPWIFGLAAHEEGLLRTASQCRMRFWALTEYGRGMGNIATYTDGYGSMVETGWTTRPGEYGGVFRSILRAPKTETDWRRKCAVLCGLPTDSRIRLWWFYSRKDDEKKHEFVARSNVELVPRPGDSSGHCSAHLREVSKLIPVTESGEMRLGFEKTGGQKLADQLFQAANDSSFKPDTNVCSSEASTGIAGQLSQFLWGILFEPLYTRRKSSPAYTCCDDVVDIVVAPNILTDWRAEAVKAGGSAAVASVSSIEGLLLDGSRSRIALPRGRRLFICSTRVPRAEMRSFLEQCEECVFTTGDQSLTEVIFMDKVPCISPDAKVQQWERALNAKLSGHLEAVPDLGVMLRRLVEDEGYQKAMVERSNQHSAEVERAIVQQLGCPPHMWNPTHQVLVKAGMFG